MLQECKQAALFVVQSLTKLFSHIENEIFVPPFPYVNVVVLKKVLDRDDTRDSVNFYGTATLNSEEGVK